MSEQTYTLTQEVLDYTGKLAPTKIGTTQSLFQDASDALFSLSSQLSLCNPYKQTFSGIVLSDVTTPVSTNAINYNTYRLSMKPDDNTALEYIYIPGANLFLLDNNNLSIPPSSTIFSSVASTIEPVYRSRSGSSATLQAIDYIVNNNTIFPSQIGYLRPSLTQAKQEEITQNGEYIITPDSGFLLSEAKVTVNVNLGNVLKFNQLKVCGQFLNIPNSLNKLSAPPLNATISGGQTACTFERYINDPQRFRIGTITWFNPSTVQLYYSWNPNVTEAYYVILPTADNGQCSLVQDGGDPIFSIFDYEAIGGNWTTAETFALSFSGEWGT